MYIYIYICMRDRISSIFTRGFFIPILVPGSFFYRISKQTGIINHIIERWNGLPGMIVEAPLYIV